MSSASIGLIQAQLNNLPNELLEGLPTLPPIGNGWLTCPIVFSVLSIILLCISIAVVSAGWKETNGGLFHDHTKGKGVRPIWRPNASQNWAFWLGCYAVLALAGDAMTIYAYQKDIYIIKYAQIPIVLSLLCIWTGMWFALCGIAFALPHTMQTRWTRFFPGPYTLQVVMIAGVSIMWAVNVPVLIVRSVFVGQMARRIDEAVAEVVHLASTFGINLSNPSSLASANLSNAELIELLGPILQPIKDVYRITSGMTLGISLFWCVANLILFIFAAAISAWLIDQLTTHIREMRSMALPEIGTTALDTECDDWLNQTRLGMAGEAPSPSEIEKQNPGTKGKHAVVEDYLSLSLSRPSMQKIRQSAPALQSPASQDRAKVSSSFDFEQSVEKVNAPAGNELVRPKLSAMYPGVSFSSSESSSSRSLPCTPFGESSRQLRPLKHSTSFDIQSAAPAPSPAESKEPAVTRGSTLHVQSSRPSLLKRLSGSAMSAGSKTTLGSDIDTMDWIRWSLAIQYVGLSVCILIYVMLAILSIWTIEPSWDLPVYVVGQAVNHCSIVAILLIYSRPKDIRKPS